MEEQVETSKRPSSPICTSKFPADRIRKTSPMISPCKEDSLPSCSTKTIHHLDKKLKRKLDALHSCPSPSSSLDIAPSSKCPDFFVESSDIEPERYFLDMLLERGYENSMENALSLSQFKPPTKHRMYSYTMDLIQLVREGDVEQLKQYKRRGVSMSACNKFGESIIHMAARTGQSELFKFLLDSIETVYICDDMGKTMLHDACWSQIPKFDIVKSILDRDASLLRVTDVRGSTPLAYVRKQDWVLWCQFLCSVKERYWPTSSS